MSMSSHSFWPEQFSFLFLLLLGTGGAMHGSDMSWNIAPGCRWRELAVRPNGKTGFTSLPPEQTGITFTNLLEERTGAANRVLQDGSGVAVGDYDGDGLPDIYFCSLTGDNVLYKNLGNWRFKDVTKEAGVACSNQFCRGAAFADINGDGFLDLLVCSTGKGVRCFLNDGLGKFTEATSSAGMATRFGSVTIALADVDGNGTLDLYVANNRTDDIRDRGQVDVQMVNGKLAVPPQFKDRLVIVDGKLLEYGEPDILYLNDGRGRFSAASWTDGTFLDEHGDKLSGPPLDWGLAATFRDMNGDGFPDIYVCNDWIRRPSDYHRARQGRSGPGRRGPDSDAAARAKFHCQPGGAPGGLCSGESRKRPPLPQTGDTHRRIS